MTRERAAVQTQALELVAASDVRAALAVRGAHTARAVLAVGVVGDSCGVVLGLGVVRPSIDGVDVGFTRPGRGHWMTAGAARTNQASHAQRYRSDQSLHRLFSMCRQHTNSVRA
jgi:hypothetical protein